MFLERISEIVKIENLIDLVAKIDPNWSKRRRDYQLDWKS